MKNFKKLENSKVSFDVKIPKDTLEKFKQKYAKEYSSKNPIKGFRAGKAPVEKVIEEAGREKFYENVADMAVREVYVKTVMDNDIQAIGSPEIKLQKFDIDKEEIEFASTVAVFPEIDMPDIKKLDIEKPDLSKIKATEKEVNNTLEKLQESRAKLITVQRESKKGDRVEVDFQLLRDKVPYEGGSSKSHPLVLGAKDSKFIPGFEDNLIGLKAGETKNFKLKFPKKYHDKNLADQEGEFEIKMNLVQERQLPELNDTFAKNIGKFKDAKDMKKQVKENIRQEKEKKEISKALDNALLKIIDETKIEIPEVMVKEEIEKMTQELEQNVMQMGLTLDQYLTQIKKSKEDIQKEWKNDAKKRITAAMILKKITEDNNLKPTQEELENRIKLMQLQNPALKDDQHKDHLNSYANHIILNEKALDWLKKEALGIKIK